MPTATKITKDIIKMQPVVVGQETTVTLVLTEFEAAVLQEAIGSILGQGEIRKAANNIYEALAEVGADKVGHHYFMRDYKLQINENNKDNQYVGF